MKTGVLRRRRLVALISVGAMVASLVSLYGGLPAQAANVTPELIEETANQTCAQLLGSQQSWVEVKFDDDADADHPLSNGTWQDGAESITVSNLGDKTFDWSSTFGIDAVYVKAGDSGSYLYEYDPEATSDTALTTPGAGDTNEISHITFCFDGQAQLPPVPSVSVDLGCDIDWTGSEFVMTATIDFVVTPDEGIESISITPKAGGDESIAGATWTGDPVALQPWAYDWVATVAAGYVGDAPSGEFDLDRGWYLTCTCPSGSIDVSNTGVLMADDTNADSLLAEPASPVSIPEGFYDIHLASYDDHSHKPDQTQSQEIWALADAEDGAGSFESPPTGDLPNDLNFMSYHVTSSTGPVLVPEFSDADLWTVHPAAPSSVNSIQPACAQLVEDPREVSVDVEATSCQVDDQGQPVGSIDVTIDPDAQATVRVYSDPGKTQLVGTLTGTDSLDDLAPGTYYWTAEAETGYELTGPSEGQVTIEDCDAAVAAAAGACAIDDQGAPLGSVDIDIDPDSSATVSVYSDAGLQNEIFSTATGGVFDLSPGTYHWVAQAADGFELDGEASGEITIEPCQLTIGGDGVCELVEGQGTGRISIEISVAGGASVAITDGEGAPVDTVDQSGDVTVAEGDTYSWQTTASDGFEISGEDSGEIEIGTCTPPEDPAGEIVVEKVVALGPDQDFDFEVDEIDWEFQLSDGESNSMTVDPGSYTIEEILPADGEWTVNVSCDGVPLANPATVTVEAGETVTCVFTNFGAQVMASILVTVGDACFTEDGEGLGRINVEISVDDGATVVVTDSQDDVVATLTESGAVTVDDEATYSWEATPSEGFEFPGGFDSSGEVEFDDCAQTEVLPFTGMDSDRLFALALILLVAGGTLIVSVTSRQPR